ncbi:MAG TPA: hypothetical protein VFL86_26305, partial [Burkholderiaceae bacterium]|nr:hypothetical protein [Burkholderiaceae bacterium]
GLAQHLAGLERRQAALMARIGDGPPAPLATGQAALAQSQALLGRLQDRVQQAAATLQSHLGAKAALQDQLERSEGLRASCERSLQALSLSPQPGAAIGSRAAAAAVPPARQAAPPEPPATAASPEETEARARVRRLAQQQQAVATERKQIDKQRAAARAEVTRRESELEFLLNPAGFMPAVNARAQNALDSYLRRLGLPALLRVPARRAQDTRYDQYLQRFTETDGNGNLRLTPDVLEAARASFSVVSALSSSIMPGMRLNSLLATLLEGRLDGITGALRNGGQDLEEVVRHTIAASFHDYIASARDLVATASARPPESSQGRQRRRFENTHVSRRTRDEVIARNGHLVSLQEEPAHRDNIIAAATHQACGVLGGLAAQCNEARTRLAAAQALLDACTVDLRHVIGQAVQLAQQLDLARERRDALQGERRRREAAQATAAARPAGAAIPQTQTPLPATDPEARQLKLRGERVAHTDDIRRARDEIAQAEDRIRGATAALQAHQAELATAAEAHARAAEQARLQHSQYREELGALRQQLKDLDARILRARDDLSQHPARRALVSDDAWVQAITRHVEPDLGKLRDRARTTGYAGAFASLADLGLAVAEIHAQLSLQPGLQALLDAGTAAEFERAAKRLPDGVIDRLHDHGRPVGHGFSNLPDQTTRPAELTQSCYSLQFVQGRVRISHLYAYVPHRRLSTLP